MRQPPFLDLLQGLRLPLLQAPMAGGPSSLSLVAAVVRAGCIGSFGFAYASPARISQDLQSLRAILPRADAGADAGDEAADTAADAATDAAADEAGNDAGDEAGINAGPGQEACPPRPMGAVNANFFVFPESTPLLQAQVDAAIAALLQAMSGLVSPGNELPDNELLLREPADPGVSAPFTPGALQVPTAPCTPTLAAQLEPVWRHRPALLSFHFGLPPAAVIERAQSLGICVGVTATRLEEARAIEEAGADVVIAQGIEAGGHRGSFDPHAADPGAHTEDLVRSIARACSLPVVAAGGIMHGSHIARMLRAGACAVQLGTAFLACEESGASPEHKRFLLQEHWRDAVLTRSFSGRLARGLHNRFIARMDGAAVLPFPLQNTLTSAMRQWAQERGDGEYQSLWAGSGYRNCRSESVEALIERLAHELRQAKIKPR